MIDLDAIHNLAHGSYRAAVLAPGVRGERLPNGRLLLHGPNWRSLLTPQEATVYGLLNAVRRALTNP